MKTNEILKSLRQDKKLTQADAAESLGVSLSSYQKYEREKNSVMPSLDVLNKMADFYKVTIDYLVGRENAEAPNPITLLNLPDDTEAVVEAISKLPPAAQKTMVDLLLQLSDAVNTRRNNNVKTIVRTIIKTVYYDAAGAGLGEPLSNEPTRTIEIIATPEAERADCVIRVNGDSMEDTLCDGDLALVTYQDELDIGDIGIFMVGDTGYIKEYGKDGLISHNPKYPLIPKQDLMDGKIVGKVIGTAELSK